MSIVVLLHVVVILKRLHIQKSYRKIEIHKAGFIINTSEAGFSLSHAVRTCLCNGITPPPIALEGCENAQKYLASLQVCNEKNIFWFWVLDCL